MWKFEIYTDKSEKTRFRLKASNGQIILASEAYNSKSACENGIESVRKNSIEDKRYDRRETKTGFKFDLKSTNGQIVGTSEVYTTIAARENGIASVTKNAPDAKVVEV